MGEMSIRVLVVDDDEDMRVTLMDFISRLGIEVSTSGSVMSTYRVRFPNGVYSVAVRQLLGPWTVNNLTCLPFNPLLLVFSNRGTKNSVEK